MGKVITWWPFKRKNEATCAKIFCCRLVCGTHNTLPLGKVLAIGWYVAFKQRREAGTNAILSILAFFKRAGGSLNW